MRVLQINKLYYPWIGGVEKVVQQISEGLQNKVDIEVLACRPKGLGQREDINGVKVQKTSSLGVYKGMPVSPTYFFRFSEMANKSDILHVHLPFPLGVISELLNFRGNYKIVVTYHSDIVRQKSLLKLYKPLLRKFLNKTDVIMSTSPNLVESSNFLKNRKEKCKVVPLAIDLDEFLGRQSKQIEPNIPDNDPVILFVGRLSYYKGVSYLLEAMERVNATLLIAGDGELRDNLEKMVDKLGLGGEIIFLGNVTDEELTYCYQNSDIFVLPSVESSEAFGIAQLEAMAHGLPVINTDLPTGVPYVSKDGKTGFTVPLRDEKAIAVAINRLLENEELYARFSENAKQRVKSEFTQERMLNSVYSIYRELMD